MSTEYYLTIQDKCPNCAHICGDSTIEIGHSSVGWCFGLYTYPDTGIITLEDWLPLLEQPNVISDEYARQIPREEMLAIITSREGGGFTDAELRRYSACPGPNGLLRHRPVMGIVHGEGTYDYLPQPY